MKKNVIKKGADPSIIIELLSSDDIRGISIIEKEIEVKKRYSEYFGKTSKETIKANIREDVIIENQKNRFLVKLPQDLKKLDIMAAHIDNINDVVLITFSQQKGNNASFNSSSESKTLESISDCIKNKTYTDFFHLLPDELNPNKNNKKYEVDAVVGMINACGKNIKIKDNISIKYLTGNDYLLYLGLEIDTVQLATQIQTREKVINHTYDAVSECCNWNEIYNKCVRTINYD